ncbi:multidrug ABC transporter permease [Paenibacillus enshidis]|uniref:Multidrug ABC transporter permease n=1 Tax=Paenibacillus enshidis TaxID=1458439 RepID=A0ABV5ATL0_9BACL
MTSSRFFFNGGVIRQNIRQHGWIGILYLAGLLFTLPLKLILGMPYTQAIRLRDLFEYHGEEQMIFILSLPVIAGVFITRYIQSRPSADLYHSLPLRREHLLTAHITSGLMLLIVPVWLTAAITAVLSGRHDLDYFFTLSDVLSWAVTVTVITLFLYSFSLLVGMCTGQSIFQAIAAYVILFLPMVLSGLLTAHFDRYLYGYPDPGRTSHTFEVFSPLYRMIAISETTLSGLELLIYTALAVLFLALSYPLYKKRHIETAGQAVAYVFFQPLFKAFVILCLMLLGSIYFHSQSDGKTGWTVAGYMLGAVVGYVISELIIRKGWQIWSRKAVFELAAYGAGIGLLLYGSVSGITGYETRIPAAYSVEAVYMGDYFDWSDTEEENSYSRDPDYISAVLSLQREVVNVRPPEIPDADRPETYRNVSISYRLKEGGMIYREYQIPEEQFRDELKNAMELEDYKKSSYWLYKLNGTASSVEISSGISPNRRVIIHDPAEMREFEQALKQDMDRLSYEEMTAKRIPEAVIDIYWKVPGALHNLHQFKSYPVSRMFTHVQAWMNKTGYAKNIKVDPGSVGMEIVDTKDYSLADAMNGFTGLAEAFTQLKETNGGYTVEDAELKKQVLEHHSDFDFGKEDAAYLIRTTVGVDERYSVLYRKDMTPELEKALRGNSGN